MSDVWDSDNDDLAYDHTIAEKDWQKLQDEFGNMGYKIGMIQGKEVNIQQGFDKVYKEGLPIGKAFGRMRGIVSTHLAFYMLCNIPAPSELVDLDRELKAIKSSDLYHADYFQESTAAASRAALEDLIASWQKRVDDTISQHACTPPHRNAQGE